MRESQGRSGIFVFKAICPKGPKFKNMKARLDHTDRSNTQDQRDVEAGHNPGKLVFTIWAVFFSPFSHNCIFFPPYHRGYVN